MVILVRISTFETLVCGRSCGAGVFNSTDFAISFSFVGSVAARCRLAFCLGSDLGKPAASLTTAGLPLRPVKSGWASLAHPIDWIGAGMNNENAARRCCAVPWRFLTSRGIEIEGTLPPGATELAHRAPHRFRRGG